MRFCRLFLLVLLCSVVCIGIFSVSVSAAVFEEYSYNGVVLPKLPDNLDSFYALSSDGTNYYFHTGKLSSKSVNIATKPKYQLVDGSWQLYTSTKVLELSLFWSNYDVVMDGITALAASEPVVTLVEVPDPPRTMDDILGDIVVIFNSCISWVGSVGSTIMEKPILLFYAALPLCGIGVGFFKRLKA